MFKIKILLLVLFFSISSKSNFASKNEARFFENSKSKIDKKLDLKNQFQKGRKTKDGRKKKKKGFMWGLFGKKKECDCPKN